MHCSLLCFGLGFLKFNSLFSSYHSCSQCVCGPLDLSFLKRDSLAHCRNVCCLVNGDIGVTLAHPECAVLSFDCNCLTLIHPTQLLRVPWYSKTQHPSS